MKKIMIEDISCEFYQFTNNKEITIYCHGFPGEVVELPKKSASQSLIEPLSQTLKPVSDLLFFRYRGLGESKGNLRLTQTFDDPKIIVAYLLKNYNYNKISFFGSSWGAIVAIKNFLNLDESLKGRLFILNPHLKFVDDSHIKEIALKYKKNLPITLKDYSIEQLISDYTEVKNSIDLPNIISNLKSSELFILQAKDDDIAIPENTFDFAKKASSPERYFLLEGCDHYFSNGISPILDVLHLVI